MFGGFGTRRRPNPFNRNPLLRPPRNCTRNTCGLNALDLAPCRRPFPRSRPGYCGCGVRDPTIEGQGCMTDSYTGQHVCGVCLEREEAMQTIRNTALEGCNCEYCEQQLVDEREYLGCGCSGGGTCGAGVGGVGVGWGGIRDPHRTPGGGYTLGMGMGLENLLDNTPLVRPSLGLLGPRHSHGGGRASRYGMGGTARGHF